MKQLDGAYAITVFCKDHPEQVVGASLGSPLVLGLGDKEHYLASDALAMGKTTQHFIWLEEGDVVSMGREHYEIWDKEGKLVKRAIQRLDIAGTSLDLGQYRHYMKKEIAEQPEAISDTVEDLLSIDPALFGDKAAELLSKVSSVHIIACGTSYYAGMVASQWIEALAGIPAVAEIASEYRYRKSAVKKDALMVFISQSGETADTLAALQHAKQQGSVCTLAICNVATSKLMRSTALSFLTRAGVEIGVASTKAFTTQLIGLFLLTLVLAKQRGGLGITDEAKHLQSIRHLPKAISVVLSALEPIVISWARRISLREHALFLGRGIHYPIALEGALKMKEITYIHAEAYPAGELKHGPLALVTSNMPVVVISPNDDLTEKLKSNMQEVRARGGELYVIADKNTPLEEFSQDESVHIARLPEDAYGMLSPVLHVVPLQLLAYHTALLRGADVDKPRNLAKTVTVE